MLSRVDVNKTSTAADLEGGIAGLINVRLRRPFDFSGFELAGSVQATTESLSRHIDPKASFLISDRWSTDMGEVGLLVDVSFKNTHTRDGPDAQPEPLSVQRGWTGGGGGQPGRERSVRWAPHARSRHAGETRTKTVTL